MKHGDEVVLKKEYLELFGKNFPGTRVVVEETAPGFEGCTLNRLSVWSDRNTRLSAEQYFELRSKKREKMGQCIIPSIEIAEAGKSRGGIAELLQKKGAPLIEGEEGVLILNPAYEMRVSHDSQKWEFVYTWGQKPMPVSKLHETVLKLAEERIVKNDDHTEEEYELLEVLQELSDIRNYEGAVDFIDNHFK